MGRSVARCLETEAIVLVLEIQLGKELLHIDFKRVTAPQHGLRGERLRRLCEVDLIGVPQDYQRAVNGFGAGRPHLRGDHLAVRIESVGRPLLRLRYSALEELVERHVLG